MESAASWLALLVDAEFASNALWIAGSLAVIAVCIFSLPIAVFVVTEKKSEL
jgi:hypothetical protein